MAWRSEAEGRCFLFSTGRLLRAAYRAPAWILSNPAMQQGCIGCGSGHDQHPKIIEPVMKLILAPTAIGINKLKANPVAVLEASEDMPIAILDGNKPVAYLMTAKAWGARAAINWKMQNCAASQKHG
jgi:hypothetical protein